MMPHAQRVAQQTGIDPRIVIAQAALESAWGRRAPGNNFFGIKSHGQPGGNTFATTEVVNGQPIRTRDSFRAYGSMGESADGYAQFLRQNPRYRPMLQAQGLDAQIQALGASGYATDPNYAAKIRQIASGIQLPAAAPAAPPPSAPPADTLEGGDGMEGLAAPDLAGTFDTMRMAAPGPMDPRARAFDQIAQAGMQPSQAMSPAPSVDDMMAGQQVQQPMQAPMPVPRPDMPTAVGQAPMPQPRPNIEPPPQAQPAMSPQPVPTGMSERDRLMLLRDEQSLAPGEAQTLRAGLAGQMAAPPQQGPSLVQMLMGGGSPSQVPTQPAPAQSQPTASAAAPVGASAGQAPAGGNARLAALLSAASNPRTPPALAAVLMGQIQRETTPATPIKMGAEDRLIDPRTGREVVAPSGNRPTDDERDYLNYEREERAAGRPVLSRFQWGQQRRRAGASQVNVGGGSDKQIFDAINESATAARSAASGLAAIQQARQAVEAGGIFGAGADTRLGLQKIASQLGLANADKVVNTETFRSAIAPQVAAMLKATVGSANISNSDREFAEKAAGGNITLDEQSIRRLLDIMERGNRGVLEGHRRRLDSVYPETGNFGRERSLFSVDAPPAPPAPGSGPRRITSQQEFNALRSGEEFIAPDGSRRRKP